MWATLLALQYVGLYISKVTSFECQGTTKNLETLNTHRCREPVTHASMPRSRQVAYVCVYRKHKHKGQF
jgi:hypothetical protein